MQVKSVSNNVSFGRLKINIDRNLLKSSPIRQELQQIKKICTENGFSRKRNVNVLLEYEKDKGFVGVVESKKQGIPNNPDYKHPISTKKDDVSNFGQWLNQWDYMYSPKGLREWAEIKAKALEYMKTPRHIVSVWRT